MDKKHIRQKTPGITFSGESCTKQQFAAECNINTIMSRYEKTGIVEHLSKTQPVYGDYSDIPNYKESLSMVIKAEELFFGLPSSIRKRFHNNPQEFLEFTQNSENLEEMQTLGLAPKPEPKIEELQPLTEENNKKGTQIPKEPETKPQN